MSVSKDGREFVSLIPPQVNKPRTAYAGGAGLSSILRDQFTISTWLCLGAILQALLFFVAGRYAFLPGVLILGTRILDVLLVLAGVKKNHLMDNVLLKKFSAQFPDDVGRYGNTPANHDVVVFIIGTRCNHPLGIYAPGFGKINHYFSTMAADLQKYREEFGMLGMRLCLDAGERKTGSEVVNICYFSSIEKLHAFAHSPYHREGWDWFNTNAKQYPHISIYHETFHVPKGNYESIYAQSHPSGITGSAQEYFDQEKGKNMWASPVVDASKGVLRTSAGRMGRSQGTEHDKYATAGY